MTLEFDVSDAFCSIVPQRLAARRIRRRTVHRPTFQARSPSIQ
jgi:hypothetical protein